MYRKTEELLYKVYPRLVNYPKSEKFSLCQNIKEAFFNILTNISLGNSVKSKRKTYLQEAFEEKSLYLLKERYFKSKYKNNIKE